MSASSNHALTFRERLFDDSPVTPAVRANDTTDIHLARGASYATEPSRPFRTASIDHIQCGHLECAPHERTTGANLGLYSVTFNNNLDRDLATLQRFHEFREEGERKGFRYFLEVFDPNMPGAVSPETLPSYINDMITRMLAGVGPTGRPVFLKVVYHGPKAMEELVRFDPNLVVGILGGSAGTTRDAFQLLHDAQKYGAKVALFGRKINNAENQLAFVHFLRLIVEGQVGPGDAVKAYHAVLGRLGLRPNRKLDEDLQLTDQSMSYAGTTVSSQAGTKTKPSPVRATSTPSTAVLSNGNGHCQCHSAAAAPKEKEAAAGCGCQNGRSVVTESASAVSRYNHVVSNGHGAGSNGRPDFTKMTPPERLAYHRQRLGLGR
jgi:hypothetical protein